MCNCILFNNKNKSDFQKNIKIRNNKVKYLNELIVI